MAFLDVRLAPEGISAIQAALSNRLQRSVNICLGSDLAMIGMTIPAVLIIGLMTDQKIVPGLEVVDALLLFATILVSLLAFSSRRTNIIHGVVHTVLFICYVVMVLDWSILC